MTKKELLELRELAERDGVTVEDLIREKELGAKTDKPFTLAVQFPRLADLISFAERIGIAGLAVYRADTLDSEYGGQGGGNRFVIRSDRYNGKPEEWRVTSPGFSPDDDE